MFKRKVKAKEYSSITIAGLEIVTNSIMMPTSSYEDSLLPELWEEFWSIFPKLGVRSTGTCFGVAIPLDQNTDPGKIKYLAGVEFKRGVPPGLEFKTVVVPAGKYVRYIHKGSMDNLKESYIDAYTNWFPKTQMEMRNAPHLELYDERFDPTSNKCEMDILIPVK